ncbi:MAG TPA: GAF domain-containing protein [Kofleriaceae bacterium]|nr:GAF domain-containing protein [Kofleriaceae bacterium]
MRARIKVHEAGERGVDGILRLIELASDDGPVEEVLSVMCDEIAAIAHADIASVYARDPGEILVMRGNHGFPAQAIGRVSLKVGEGITGMVAERMRPVSAESAADEKSYKHVPGLGEEQFPVFLGVPLIGGGAVVGVLVLQRRARPAFGARDVALATALGAPVTLALERRRASAARSARLHGAPLGGAGTVIGRADVVPTSTALAGSPGDLTSAIARLREDLDRAFRRLCDSDDPEIGGALDRLALALMDQRLRDRLAEAAARPGGLREVARDYARIPYKLGADAASADRVIEIEELCVLLGTVDGPPLRPGAVWLGQGAGAFVTLIAVARGAAALVCASDAITPAAAAIARAAGLPLVSAAHGVFGWARPGDLLAVDGATGTVIVNPPPADVERVRASRRA